MRSIRFFMVGAVIGLGLLMAVGGGAQQGECSITVQAGQSLKEAISVTSPGAVICLGPGIWYENLTLEKTLHIRGAGPQATFIKGANLNYFFVFEAGTSSEAISIKLEDMTITESYGGIIVSGSAWVSVHNVILTGHPIALAASGTSHLELSQVTVVDNETGLSVGGTARVSGSGVVIAKGEVGMAVRRSAFVHLEELEIFQQKVGILMEEVDGAHVRLSASKLSENRVGLAIIGNGEVKLLDTTFEANWLGLRAEEGGVVAAERVTIAHSQRDGLVAANRVVVSLVASKISENGVHPNCQWVAWVCNGLTVLGAANVWITNSVIQGNADWGIAAWKRECGYGQDLFEGQVMLLGAVQIEGNNTSGNHKGAGKPEGQVCLP